MDMLIALRIAGYADGIRRRAITLRELADELDREAARAEKLGTPEYGGAEFSNNMAWIASQVQHHVISALPNLRLDQLTTDAHDIDDMREA
jgi:hypothetical protein